MDIATLLMRVGVPVALLVSLVVVRRLDRPRGRWRARLRSRLLLGLPWGTLVSMAGVYAVYLFVQRGVVNWHDPLVIPFVSWSYLYPLGVVTAPFSHANAGHLTGNMLGTLVLAPLAEYAWSHFPTRRGSSSFSSWWTNPYVRAFVLFPLGVLFAGLASSLLSWGPVIGFSSVVFAFAGFALVRFPIATVVALLVRSVVNTTYTAFLDPVVPAQASSSFSRPWWVGIAVQGHLLGLFLGVLLGVLLVARREERPSALRLWLGTVLLGSSLTIWAVWWYRGTESFVLYRGLGVVLLYAVAIVVVLGVLASEKPLVGDLTRRRAATMLVVLPLLVMAMVAVPVNSTTVAAGDTGADAVTVRDYTVTYAENVPNKKVAAFDVSMFGETTRINTSGVIVMSRERHLWTQEISKGALAFDGTRSVQVGGLTWSETVTAQRRGWSARGDGTAYVVSLRVADGEYETVFQSGPATADAVVDGKNVSVLPEDGRFFLVVSRESKTLAREPMPAVNSTVTVSGIEFVRGETKITAVSNETRIPIASRETYE